MNYSYFSSNIYDSNINGIHGMSKNVKISEVRLKLAYAYWQSVVTRPGTTSAVRMQVIAFVQHKHSFILKLTVNIVNIFMVDRGNDTLK